MRTDIVSPLQVVSADQVALAHRHLASEIEPQGARAAGGGAAVGGGPPDRAIAAVDSRVYWNNTVHSIVCSAAHGTVRAAVHSHAAVGRATTAAVAVRGGAGRAAEVD